MTETSRQTSEGEVNQELPVDRDYLGDLVRNYISYPHNSQCLNVLGSEGLPELARKKPRLPTREDNIRQDLKDVLFTVLETYGLWGEVMRKVDPAELRRAPYKTFVSNQGLPHLGKIVLKDSLNTNNPTVRFAKKEDGSIIVKGVYLKDFSARGLPSDFNMASEYLAVDPQGKVTRAIKYWPGTNPNGPERQYFKVNPVSSNSLLTLKYLVEIALNGAKLQEQGHIYETRDVVNKRGVSQKKVEVKPRVFT